MGAVPDSEGDMTEVEKLALIAFLDIVRRSLIAIEKALERFVETLKGERWARE